MEDDGFQLVSRKKAARASKVHTQSTQGEYDGIDSVELRKRIDKLKYEEFNVQYLSMSQGICLVKFSSTGYKKLPHYVPTLQEGSL